MIVKSLLHPCTWWNWCFYFFNYPYTIFWTTSCSDVDLALHSNSSKVSLHRLTELFLVIWTLSFLKLYFPPQKYPPCTRLKRNKAGVTSLRGIFEESLFRKKHSVSIGFYFSPCISMLVFMLLFKGSPARWRVHTHVKLHSPSLIHRISVVEKRDAGINQYHCQPALVQHKLSAGAFYIKVHWNNIYSLKGRTPA